MEAEKKQRIAFISGSTRGIGLAVAKELLKKGYLVICNSTREKESIEGEFSQLLSETEHLEYIKGNMMEADEVQRVFHTIIDKHRKVDVIVNNVGGSLSKPFIRWEANDFNECINKNLLSAIYCTRYGIKAMMMQKYGKIINISSMAGIHGLAFQAGYAAAKAGLIGFTKTIAKEYGSMGVTCNTVAPGIIGSNIPKMKQVEEKVLGQLPIRRLGTPEDIAHLVGFLVSDEASYITGQVIEVNGGLFV